MLPDEIMQRIDREFPCRELQIRHLCALFSPSLPAPSLLVAHGLTATGKTSVIKTFLSLAEIPHAFINSRECITGRHLLERTTAACLDALDGHGGEGEGKIDRRPYARTENINALAMNLQRMLENWGQARLVLVLDGIDAQREAPATLLAALARFGERIPSLSIILITTLPPTTLHKPGTPHLHFPAYTRSALLQILNLHPPTIFPEPPSLEQYPDYTPDLAAEDDAWLWNRFLGAVWDSLSKHTGRDLISFRNTSMRLWRDFVRPITDGTFGTRDFSRLMVNRRHLFQGEEAVLDRIISAPDPNIAPSANGLPSTPSTALARKTKTIQHDLPYYTTHLLIAAYLASYNPSRTDPTYFMKHTDKRKNRRRVHTNNLTTASTPNTKARRIPRHLLTPSPFPLDRLLAIFRALLEGPVPQVADVAGGQAGGDVLEVGGRWRVGFGWEWVRGLGRGVGIEVGEYLVGGVEG
ncbi:hypothetical protein P154DRAFT_557396 [Amniculicola lignicola CBS 123094]|uniref:Uncharacterized protein n=1 Tax=Amniculicola lignicola CBS 123094 TaxID=1392246 RepID=A0A6A5VWM5_9PLEO|nr:hypothetical protein P154DRAFT_557396 [Amniculicola lignicola CBS 123094]